MKKELKKAKAEKVTKYSLKKDEVALVLGDDSMMMYFPKGVGDESPVNDQMLTLTAIATLLSDGDAKFGKIVEKRIKKFLKENKQ